MNNSSPWRSSYDASIRSQLEYPAINLVEFLQKRIEKFANKVLLDFAGFQFTYAEAGDIIHRLANGLREFGVHPGDRVGLILPNSAQFVFVYYAILESGAIVVPLSVAYTQAELEKQIQETQISTLIAWQDKAFLCECFKEKSLIQRFVLTGIEELEKFKSASVEPAFRADRGSALFDIYTLSARPALQVAVDPDATAVLQFSGGTTGTIKAAVASHKNILANTLQFREWLTDLAEGEERFLTVIPLSHVYGMVIGLNVAVAMGATIYLLPNPRDTQKILETIEKQKITFYPGVPSMYYAINQHPDVRTGKYNLHSIKACISGSAPLSPEIRLEFEKFTGGKLVEGYGLTEAPTATHCNPILGENRNGSIGLPLPDVECKLLALPDLPPGCGELLMRGPQVIKEYYQKPEETAHLFFDGWLRTGDIARMDAEGYFYLLGRTKELIKVGGFQVWPREVEEVIEKMAPIKEVVITGTPDLAKGELVKAWVVLKKGAELNLTEIKQFCEGKLAHYKIPRVLEFIESVPRTPVGKVLRRQLVEGELKNKSGSQR